MYCASKICASTFSAGNPCIFLPRAAALVVALPRLDFGNYPCAAQIIFVAAIPVSATYFSRKFNLSGLPRHEKETASLAASANANRGQNVFDTVYRKIDISRYIVVHTSDTSHLPVDDLFMLQNMSCGADRSPGNTICTAYTYCCRLRAGRSEWS